MTTRAISHVDEHVSKPPKEIGLSRRESSSGIKEESHLAPCLLSVFFHWDFKEMCACQGCSDQEKTKFLAPRDPLSGYVSVSTP